MRDYLIFRLYGPMASWGEIAVGEFRHSARHPSRSALVGLLAAACGVERTDDDGQRQMATGYRFGVKVESFGSPLRDYHTAQYGEPERRQRFRTRRDELENARKVGTLLTSREYRCDSIATVAVEALPAAPHDLPKLVSALQQPRFVLYLGRKSCPPAIPLAPVVVSAENLKSGFSQAGMGSLAALAGRSPQQAWPSGEDRRLFDLGEVVFYWEEGMTAGIEPHAVMWRHDQPLSRTRWQFANRREWTAQEGGVR